MPKNSNFEVRVLGSGDCGSMHAMLDLFGEVFEDADTYGAARPDDQYLSRLLAGDSFIAVAARDDDTVVGALTAYVLPKFERARNEIYIYDLAVAESHRRCGIATALIRKVHEIAAQRAAWVVMIQADRGDEAPIALYGKLGKREEILHFDLTLLP